MNYLVKYPEDMKYYVDEEELNQTYISKQEAIGRIQNAIDSMIEEKESDISEIIKEIEIYEISERLEMNFSINLVDFGA